MSITYSIYNLQIGISNGNFSKAPKALFDPLRIKALIDYTKDSSPGIQKTLFYVSKKKKNLQNVSIYLKVVNNLTENF